MGRTANVLVSLSLVVLLGFTDAQAKCSFIYTEDIRHNIVDVEINRKQLPQYDDQDPVINIKGDTVRLSFMPKPLKDGRSWLDPPYFVVVVEACGKGSVRSGLQAWDVAAGVRKPLPGEDEQPGYLH